MKVNIIQDSRFAYLDGDLDSLSFGQHSYLVVRDKSYKIKGVKKSTKDFTYQTIDKDVIALPRKAAAYVMRGDEIKLNIPSFSLETILSIKKSRMGFNIGDTISIHSQNVSDEPAIIIVTATDDKGRIKMVDIQSVGVYASEPENVKYINDSDEGRELKLEMDLFFKKNASVQTPAIIKKIHINATELILNLNFNVLPFNFEDTVYISKPVLWIEEPFDQETAIEEPCGINSNFTPHLGFPYMLPNSPSQHQIYNEMIQLLDNKIQKLEEKIKTLEGN